MLAHARHEICEVVASPSFDARRVEVTAPFVTKPPRSTSRSTAIRTLPSSMASAHWMHLARPGGARSAVGSAPLASAAAGLTEARFVSGAARSAISPS